MYNTVGASLFERRKSSKLNIVINVILVLLVFICVAELAFNMRYTCIWVDGSSMLPTLVGEDAARGNSGEYVFADKKRSPTYGDIVVVRRTVRSDGGSNTSYIIKRVIAFGGDSVKMIRGILYRKLAGEEDFSEVKEPYIMSDVDPNAQQNNFSEHLVADGMIYVLGDNRNISNDSRAHGDFDADAVIGVVPEWSLKHKAGITGFFRFFNSVFKFAKKTSDQ